MPCVVTETAFTFLFIAGLCEGATILLREHFYVSVFKNWYEALQHCRAQYTGLSNVLTEDDVERVINSVPGRATTSAWIGLKQDSDRQWRWSGGKALDINFNRWASGEPGSDYSNDCVYARDGLWYNKRCDDHIPFYCCKPCNGELTVVQEKMTWEDALVYCRSNNTNLSSLPSNYTAEKVISSTVATTDFVWTGLRFLMGEWFWVDGEAIGLEINWKYPQNSACPSATRRCGALSVQEKVFVAMPCDEELNFICYSKL
ncbi:lymphocyte antigen 75-like [Anguilla anguilla]|uniref:lymphocyte antigen 75-like n=1 Tax=Anguilla anguilla TaxID=7936 RepID=UPI0015AB5010|nr:lymphocyte antigen 75-like [Anguilla anguilla]